MTLGTFLSQKRSAILEKWFDLIIKTYPVDTQGFLKRQKNRFANPVGYTISKEIAAIYDGLFGEEDSTDRISAFLDRIIRIRAIQDFSPSAAIAFVFFLKKVIREELENEPWEGNMADELWKLEEKIDHLALLSFDIYMKCREKIYELKENEVKNMTFRLLQRANIIWENPEQKQDKDGVSEAEHEAR
jgi:hypothetical protein